MWLERLVAGGPGAGGDEAEEADGAGGGAGAGNEGALMKAVRVLGARLLGLSDPPKAPIGYAHTFDLCAGLLCLRVGLYCSCVLLPVSCYDEDECEYREKYARARSMLYSSTCSSSSTFLAAACLLPRRN